MAGLVQVQMGDPEENAQERTAKDSLGAYLYGLWCEWRDARLPIEDEWLQDLRNYAGIYDAKTLAEIGENRSKVFVHLTRTKTQAAYARIIDLLFANAERPWALNPTPEPELAPSTLAELAMEAAMVKLERLAEKEARAIQNGAPPPAGLPDLASLKQQIIAGQVPHELKPTKEELEPVIRQWAEKAAEKMSTRIEDQLDEAHYDFKLRTAIAELCMFGSCVTKGATTETRQATQWAQREQNTKVVWLRQTVEKEVPAFDAPSIFDSYPDSYAECVTEGQGFFERLVLTRGQFLELGDYPGFNRDVIDEIIRDNPKGNHVALNHEIERRSIAGFTTTTGADRYEVLVYWGSVHGDVLARMPGFEAREDENVETGEFPIISYTCGGRTIRLSRNDDLDRIPYQITPYEAVPHQLWGVGPPRQMRDSQAMINVSSRALVDNAALSSMPQVEINLDMMAEGYQNDTDVVPGKKWFREGQDPAYPMVRYNRVPNTSGPMAELVGMFRRYADEETNLPSYTHGEQLSGLNKTATGVSLLMRAANVVTKSVIKNIDDCLLKLLIQSFYHWNMRFADDESIKGDMQVIARGTSALIAREVQSQRLIEFLQLAASSPATGQLIMLAYLLREIARSLEIDPDKAVKSDDEIEELIRATSESGAGADGNPGMGGAGPGVGSAPAVPPGPA